AYAAYAYAAAAYAAAAYAAYAGVYDWHSALAASSLSQFLLSLSSSSEQCCDESEMPSGAMDHLRDRSIVCCW
ncbi:unnamed protein product, partial [Didymodactylos carnosus]